MAIIATMMMSTLIFMPPLGFFALETRFLFLFFFFLDILED